MKTKMLLNINKFGRKIKKCILKRESNIPRQMANSKNGMMHTKDWERFDNFDKFMNWYNTVRFHESLDTKWYLQTPDSASWSSLTEGCKLKMFLDRMVTELNVRD